MSISNNFKKNAFSDGFVGFFAGKPKEMTYSKNANDITAQAWQMTGDSLRRAMDNYDRERTRRN